MQYADGYDIIGYDDESTLGYVTINDNVVKYTQDMDVNESYDDITVDDDIEIEYKIKNILYRYNVQDNIYLTNFAIKNGYKIIGSYYEQDTT
jgi:hypothetical protein